MGTNSILSSVLIVCIAFSQVACNKPSLQTILLWGKQGLDQVCAVGQDTLPDVVCMEGDTVIDLAMGIAEHDNPATRMAINKLLTDAIAKYPDLGIYLGWLLTQQTQFAILRRRQGLVV